MQVPVFTIGYTAASASNSSCRDATGFPLPSTGRGIEGEGWLYLKLPFLPFMQKNSQNPRNITFYALKQESTTAETSRPHANPWAVGRVTPCAPLLTSKSPSHPSCHFPNAFLLRNTLCKCLFLQHVTPAASAPNSSGLVALGGRSRAATPFACGAGTLWRGFAEALRMTLLPSKQPSFPNASLN